MAVLPLRIQVRRDQDALFNAENPLLLEGEIAFSIDKNKVKIGDGLNNWQGLDYLDDELAARVDVLTSDETVDGSVDAKVAAEAALRTEVDTALAARIDTLEGDDSVAGSVDGKIMVEAAARQAADEILQQEIDAIKTDVLAKEIESNSGDALLDSKIDNLSASVEANRLASESADATIQADVDANQAASETADGTLQTNINLEAARVDALIQSGMWLFANQADFPSATANHGRIVHSHADASMFYAHEGLWHKIEREDEAQAARDVLQDNINQEALRAGTAEAANATAITAEETRALAAEAVNATAITAEETRALAAEGALDTRTTALEDTLNGSGTASDDDGIANKANYAYSAIVATPDGIHAKLDGLETNKASLSGAAFTGAVSVDGTFQLTDVAALAGALTVDGISELKGGLVVTGGGSTTTTFNVGTDLGVGGNAIVTGNGNFGVGLEVKEQVLARSAALNDNPAGPDATPIIPFLAAKSDDVVTKQFLDNSLATKADATAAAPAVELVTPVNNELPAGTAGQMSFFSGKFYIHNGSAWFGVTTDQTPWSA